MLHTDIPDASATANIVRDYRRYNRILAALILAFFSWATVTAYGYGLWRQDQPGPGLVPFIVSLALVALSVLWLIFPGMPETDDPPSELEADGDDVAAIESAGEEVDRGKLALILALSIANIVALSFFGYSIAMFAYVAALLIFVSKRGVLWTLIGTFIGVLASEYMFQLLGVALPRGSSSFAIDFLSLFGR